MQELGENELRYIYWNSLRSLLVRIIRADGLATESEITQFVGIWQQLTKEVVSKDQVRTWCKDIEHDRITLDTHLRALASVTNDAGKDLVFKAALILSLSDGSLQKQEIDLLNKIAAYFQFNPERIATLMQELGFGESKTTSQTYYSTPPKKLSSFILRLLAILSIMIVAYTVIRYFIDLINYNNGHQAYQQANCTAAIISFDNIINGWRMVDLGGYTSLAQQEKSECLSFQAAVDKEKTADFSAALIAYADFISKYSDSILVKTARIRSVALFEQTNPSTLASLESCKKLDTFLEMGIFSQHDDILPPFFFACGQVYDKANNYQSSFAVYVLILTKYPNHSLADQVEASLLANPISCEEIDSLQTNSAITSRVNFIPTLYYSCGQAYEKKSLYTNAFEMYKMFLLEYPEHWLFPKIETALLANPTSCVRYSELQNTVIEKQDNFKPSLFYNCGQAYENNRDWANAITMYEKFLAEFPSHSLALDVEAALARSIVEQAKASGGFEIPEPERSGFTRSGVTEVVIQNDSPERLRIVFSGPESHVEELEACGACTTYTGIGPLYCPEKGPIGRYTLTPGQYDIVVESITDGGTTPWKANWVLTSGYKYYNCFFIVTYFFP